MKPIIDISAWQPPTRINYDQLATQVNGVILRVAYGTRADIHFATHYREFRARNIPVGAYHYIVEYKTVAEQITTAMTALGDRKLQLGFWVDVELEPNATPLTASTTVAYTLAVEARLGYKAGVYTSASMWRSIFGNSNPLADRDLWVAYYTTGNVPILPTGWSTWKLWQYTSEGRLNGYTGDLDTNRFSGTQADFDAWAGNVGEPVDPPTDPDQPTQPKAYKATVTANVLNVRKAPHDIVVGSLKYGAEVEVLDERDAWRKLGHQLWVSGEYLKRIANAPELPIGVIDLILYSQNDPRWKNKLLGTSNTTIGNYGCLVTCIASVLTKMGYKVDPAQLVDLITARVGWHNGNQYYWNSPLVLFGDVHVTEFIDCYNVPAPLGRLDAILQSGRPATVHVDYKPETPANDQHWVNIIGKKGASDYWIHDPIDGALAAFSDRYRSPAQQIFRIVGYSRK